MSFQSIKSLIVITAILAVSAVPAFADDDKGKGKKKGHYKNGKAYGMHPSEWKRVKSDDDDDDRRRERQRRSRQDSDRWTASTTTNRSKSELDRLSRQRQETKNEWRNLAYLSGGVALLGILQKDNRLVFAGSSGALYSLYRYEQDRKSQSKVDRLRASYFSQPYFTRDGRRYDRRVVSKDGQRYYQFVRR